MLVKALRSARVFLVLLLVVAAPRVRAQTADSRTYSNPVRIVIPTGGLVESCADPSIIKSQVPEDPYWYAYCTSDPLNDDDRDANRRFKFHLISILKSSDLVSWSYAGDAFEQRPSWLAADSGVWAPAIKFFGGTYYLYYTAQKTALSGAPSAIGVATSAGPAGPWTDSGAPVVEPHAAPCCPGTMRWVFDPEVVEHEGQRYIYYGSYSGGVSVRKLSDDGLRSDPASQVEVAIPNRYEGVNVVKRGDYFYLFASATDCCRGPLTGYSVFAARSLSPLGPFLDREGVSLLDSRVGGSVVISMNGNRWVGPGHNAIFTDARGQDWFLYHAVDRNRPYFAGSPGFTRRPLLMDSLDWIDDWPVVRGGLWASDSPQPAPATQPDMYIDRALGSPNVDTPADLIDGASDEFNDTNVSSQWHWIRAPDPLQYGMTGENFRFNTQRGDLFESSNSAPVLLETAPPGDFLVETRVNLNVPASGCCFNYVQAGLLVYKDDDNYIKFVHASISETRQTEFAKEMTRPAAGYPRYGNSVVGPPGDWTYLRIARRIAGDEELYTAYSSRDGQTWRRGGTWTHRLGSDVQIGLVSMGGSGFTANFDYVRVYKLN